MSMDLMERKLLIWTRVSFIDSKGFGRQLPISIPFPSFSQSLLPPQEPELGGSATARERERLSTIRFLVSQCEGTLRF